MLPTTDLVIFIFSQQIDKQQDIELNRSILILHLKYCSISSELAQALNLYRNKRYHLSPSHRCV